MKDVVTYLNFDGNCKEAMTFYAQHLEGELQLTPFTEEHGMPAAAKGRMMHARVVKNGAPILMASDLVPGMPFKAGNDFAVSVTCESLAELERVFGAFSDGAKIGMPLQDMFWGARFGMLTDRFGIRWMFNFEHPKAGAV